LQPGEICDAFGNFDDFVIGDTQLDQGCHAADAIRKLKGCVFAQVELAEIFQPLHGMRNRGEAIVMEIEEVP